MTGCPAFRTFRALWRVQAFWATAQNLDVGAIHLSRRIQIPWGPHAGYIRHGRCTIRAGRPGPPGSLSPASACDRLPRISNFPRPLARPSVLGTAQNLDGGAIHLSRRIQIPWGPMPGPPGMGAASPGPDAPHCPAVYRQPQHVTGAGVGKERTVKWKF